MVTLHYKKFVIIIMVTIVVITILIGVRIKMIISVRDVMDDGGAIYSEKCY